MRIALKKTFCNHKLLISQFFFVDSHNKYALDYFETIPCEYRYGALNAALDEGAVALVDGHWLVDFAIGQVFLEVLKIAWQQ